MNMLRGTNANTAGGGGGPNDHVSTSLEQERYLNGVITATPIAMIREGSSWAMTDSMLSINSLGLAVSGN